MYIHLCVCVCNPSKHGGLLLEAGFCNGSKAAARMAQELYPTCPDALVFPVPGAARCAGDDDDEDDQDDED